MNFTPWNTKGSVRSVPQSWKPPMRRGDLLEELYCHRPIGVLESQMESLVYLTVSKRKLP